MLSPELLRGNWTTDAWYSILDGSEVIYSQRVDQQDSPSGTAAVNGDVWQLLANRAAGTGDADISVVVSAWNPANLNDYGDGLPLQVGTVMVVPVRPAVTVQPVGQGSSQVAAGNTYAYAAWQDSWQPAQIPVDGEGDRTELQLHAAIDQVFSCGATWQASLEDAVGLDFWTSPTGGSPMTAEEFNATIPADNYDGDVWVSQDAAYAGSATPPITLDFQGDVGDPVLDAGSGSMRTVAQKQYHVVISYFGPWTFHEWNTSAQVAVDTMSELMKQISNYNESAFFGRINARIDLVGIPVAWGSPEQAIAAEVGKYNPLPGELVGNGNVPIDFWLALGENDGLPPGQYRVECRATDYRNPYFMDNNNVLGDGYGNRPPLADFLGANAAVRAFAAAAPLSDNAGSEQCNEMAFDLYQPANGVSAAAFVHVAGSAYDEIGISLGDRLFQALREEQKLALWQS
jgi:hypothetical protein